MPIHPIGELNRKGELGSYYSVKDYLDVNPRFGTKEDFRNLVNAVHEQGMHIIIDWVANHSAWDNENVTKHPEWYATDDEGNMFSPFDWSDVVQFNYENQEMRNYMTDALKYWVEEFDIDGYRCDVAGMVPVDFWNHTVRELRKIKPIFMLAEDEDHLELLDTAFNMHYGWHMHHLMNTIAQGKADVTELKKYFRKTEEELDADDVKMNFLTNHDENSWNGTINERMGDAQKAMAVLSWTIPGMPLIYSGQEIGLDKRLEFFKKDPIEWRECKLETFYSKLNQLKADNPALWAPDFGGDFKILDNTEPEKVFAFIRNKEDNKVLVILNLSNEDVVTESNDFAGTYTDFFKDEKIEAGKVLELEPWDFRVYVK
jgi:glycosidase